MEEKCFNIERFQERFDSFNVEALTYRKVGELTRKTKLESTRLIDRDGHVIIDKQEVLDG